MMIRSLTFLCLAMFVLSACGGGAGTEQEQPPQIRNCSCADYPLSQTKPDWTRGDDIRDGIYYSVGIEQCTGVQKIDLEKTNLKARANLGRIIGSQVSSRISRVQRADGGGTGSNSAKIQSTATSDAFLQNSQVYDYWLDVDNCAIHAAVKISEIDIERGLAKLAAIEKSKLKNQKFYVEAIGNNATILDVSVKAILSDLGVKKIVGAPQKGAYKIEVALKNGNVTANQQTYRAQFVMHIYDSVGTLVWSWHKGVKGVFLRPTTEADLINRAVRSAKKPLMETLQERLDKPSKI